MEGMNTWRKRNPPPAGFSMLPSRTKRRYPTIKPYRMGDEVLLLLTLMDDSERIAVAARVVWITPVGAQNRRRAGIGAQFSAKDGGATQKRIEVHLAGAIDSERPTLTL